MFLDLSLDKIHTSQATPHWGSSVVKRDKKWIISSSPKLKREQETQHDAGQAQNSCQQKTLLAEEADRGDMLEAS